MHLSVTLCPLREQLAVVAEGKNVRRGECAEEGFPPKSVDPREALPLHGELMVDIVRVEDGLQVHPVALAGEPLRDDVLEVGSDRNRSSGIRTVTATELTTAQ